MDMSVIYWIGFHFIFRMPKTAFLNLSFPLSNSHFSKFCLLFSVNFCMYFQNFKAAVGFIKKRGKLFLMENSFVNSKLTFSWPSAVWEIRMVLMLIISSYAHLLSIIPPLVILNFWMIKYRKNSDTRTWTRIPLFESQVI